MAEQDSLYGQTKSQELAQATNPPTRVLTDDQGHPIADDQNSLRVGARGPTLMEDFHFREKLHHFDHEPIPERVVHARGSAAGGYFQVYDASMAQYTRARVLTDPSIQTPVYVRFSIVLGSRGTADTTRDVRGFATKFYTDEGNWDLVGNNIPVFFIQDAIKFPDLIHSAKPEPDVEIPTGSTAHDTFYDFISLTPESMHMIMWVMSGRGIPRYYSMMEGFGVHTFRLINAQGASHYVKFHWKPMLGVHSLVWDEAQRIAGKDPDFHRRNLADSIRMGVFPEWELGVQVFAEGEEARFDFDILDPTKIIPEELVPIRRIGKMTLNRNPENFFAQTEQVAFMTQNVVPGIDFTDDPLLQGRNFSYLDTQLSRLGSPNWPELPINRTVAKVSNNQRRGHMRYEINPGRVNYEPNSLGGNIPNQISPAQGGFATYPERVSGPKVRQRSQTFHDHYGQARLFWNSMTPPEREQITHALQFELSKVATREIRLRMLNHLHQINNVLGAQVALALGEAPRTAHPTAPPPGTAESNAQTTVLANATSATSASGGLQRTRGLSEVEGQPMTPKGRQVAILAADGVDGTQVEAMMAALTNAGAKGVVVGPHLGALGGGVEATMTFANTDSVLYDAVYVPGGAASARALVQKGDAIFFIEESYKHAKPIATIAEGVEVLTASAIGRLMGGSAAAAAAQPGDAEVQNLSEVGHVLSAARGGASALGKYGVVVGQSSDLAIFVQQVLTAVAHHRYWGRPGLNQIPA